ncbi:uncharacterized protein LOC121381823 [Gigantopelta aegis]|uniref:uncharacterized protein LOC121381823 n=1 Tax=Gigantopelta aegis TaxID=1735272 RepID=UPI001B88A42E|nr:uncharacterized protein LOC121381823 [Gigantopelta aegis]
MEGYTVLVIVALSCIGKVSATDVTLTPAGKKYVNVGESLTMVCEIHESVNFLLSQETVFMHKNMVTKTETILTRQKAKLEGIDNYDNYEVDMSIDGNIIVRLTIHSIAANMDGEFSCRIKPLTEQEWSNQATVDLIVIKPPSAIEMTFQEQVIMSEMQQGIKLKEGMYSVVCKSVGSNPAASLALQIGNQVIEGNTEVTMDDAEMTGRQYVSRVEGHLNFDHKHFNQHLVCTAELPHEVGDIDRGTIKASVELIGVAEKPVVYCMNTSSAVGDRYVKITCIVAKNPKTKSVAFEIGSTNTVLVPNEQTEDFTEVVEKDYNGTHRAITLVIHTVERGDFLEEYYFNVVGVDGKDYRYPVHLQMMTIGASSNYVSGFLLSAACVLAMFGKFLV